MRSQGLPSSFLPAHLGINYDPPSPRHSAGWLDAHGRLTEYPPPRSATYECTLLLLEGVRQSVYLPWSLLSPSICLLSLDLLTSVSLPHKRAMCSMLRVSAERDDGVSPSSHRPYCYQNTNTGELRFRALLSEVGVDRLELPGCLP